MTTYIPFKKIGDNSSKHFHMITMIGLDTIILGNSMLSRISYIKGH